MPIEFTCPNGHRLSCPEQIIGRQGQCPKCGAGFRVPAQSSDQWPPSQPQQSSAELNDLAGASGRGPAPAPLLATPEGSMVFLCPNGHRLNGPLSLQGRPGKCPHCHAKFLIPTYDAEDEEDVQIVSDGLAADHQDLVQEPDFGTVDEDIPLLDSDDDPLLDRDRPTGNASTGSQSLLQLFRRFWKERTREGTVEITLKDGTRFVPQIFGEALSSGSLGVFAVQEEDGSTAVTAVPWDSILQITLRGSQAASSILRELDGEAMRS